MLCDMNKLPVKLSTLYVCVHLSSGVSSITCVSSMIFIERRIRNGQVEVEIHW